MRWRSDVGQELTEESVGVVLPVLAIDFSLDDMLVL